MDRERIIQERSEIMFDLWRQVWQAEWVLRDAALELVQEAPELVRAIAHEMNTSHQNVYRWAAQAAAIPSFMRRPEYSVREQVRQAKKDGRLK